MSGPLSMMPEGQIDFPSQTVLLIDSNDPGAGGASSARSMDGYNPVHQKGANAAFADGHVQRVKPGELAARNFRPYDYGL
jgi:prepilin-type processing-associated H-X9-DG protein